VLVAVEWAELVVILHRELLVMADLVLHLFLAVFPIQLAVVVVVVFMVWLRKVVLAVLEAEATDRHIQVELLRRELLIQAEVEVAMVLILLVLMVDQASWLSLTLRFMMDQVVVVVEGQGQEELGQLGQPEQLDRQVRHQPWRDLREARERLGLQDHRQMHQLGLNIQLLNR
jgi:hypothetical protein